MPQAIVVEQAEERVAEFGGGARELLPQLATIAWLRSVPTCSLASATLRPTCRAADLSSVSGPTWIREELTVVIGNSFTAVPLYNKEGSMVET
jgi:hypothetical protein